MIRHLCPEVSECLRLILATFVHDGVVKEGKGNEGVALPLGLFNLCRQLAIRRDNL